MARSASVVRSPSVSETSFNCPHCGALAKQFWYDALARQLKEDDTPSLVGPEDAATFFDDIEEGALRDSMKNWASRMAEKTPFLAESTSDPYARWLYNLHISKPVYPLDACIEFCH